MCPRAIKCLDNTSVAVSEHTFALKYQSLGSERLSPARSVDRFCNLSDFCLPGAGTGVQTWLGNLVWRANVVVFSFFPGLLQIKLTTGGLIVRLGVYHIPWGWLSCSKSKQYLLLGQRILLREKLFQLFCWWVMFLYDFLYAGCYHDKASHLSFKDT